jgi:hypothetical protein
MVLDASKTNLQQNANQLTDMSKTILEKCKPIRWFWQKIPRQMKTNQPILVRLKIVLDASKTNP